MKHCVVTIHVDRVHSETREAFLTQGQQERARLELDGLKAGNLIWSFNLTVLDDSSIVPDELFGWIVAFKEAEKKVWLT